MATHEFFISINSDSTESHESKLSADPEAGADVKFLGVVRDVEDDRKISGIDYSCYEPMALRQLRHICEELTACEEPHRVLIHHRIGFVPIGVPSIVIRVQTKHSSAGFSLCQEYLARIKSSVPIWKRPVFVDDESSDS